MMNYKEIHYFLLGNNRAVTKDSLVALGPYESP